MNLDAAVGSDLSRDRSSDSKFEYFEMQIKCETFDVVEDVFHRRKKVTKFCNEQMNNNGRFCVTVSFKLLI